MSFNEKKTSHIYLMRHGQSIGNELKIIQGHDDFPLTDKGREQARQIAKVLSGVEIHGLYASDLMRAYETATIIGIENNLPYQVIKDMDLRERYMGKFQGQSTSINPFRQPEYLALAPEQRFKHKVTPDIESEEELVQRNTLALSRIAISNLDKNVVVVAHRGVLLNQIINLGGGPYPGHLQFEIPNIGYIHLISDGHSFEIMELINISPSTASYDF